IAVLCIAVDRFNPAELIRPTIKHRDDIINPVISTLMELTPVFTDGDFRQAAPRLNNPSAKNGKS
ncbi:hypothetical protein, partial [Serratia marcescens]|uniref:hypothetical protein n=1 Tax=Serratia marcescens TaxID=615 RepID=UPI00344EB17B